MLISLLWLVQRVKPLSSSKLRDRDTNIGSQTEQICTVSVYSTHPLVYNTLFIHRLRTCDRQPLGLIDSCQCVLTRGMTLAFFSTDRPSVLSASPRKPCRASAWTHSNSIENSPDSQNQRINWFYFTRALNRETHLLNIKTHLTPVFMSKDEDSVWNHHIINFIIKSSPSVFHHVSTWINCKHHFSFFC